MTFPTSQDQQREEYFRDGFTILRGVIPPSLLADLRRDSDRAREIARQKSGPQAQRLQPVYAYEELNHQLYRDFLGLPGMRAAVENILGTGHRQSDIMGILLEPAEKPWCTAWHRDWGYNVPGIDLEAFFRNAREKLHMFNQINAALYDDHSLWAVPGSHAREDTPEERAAFPRVPPPGPELTDAMSSEERERACLEYARQMPGAIPVVLFAGDCAFYRNSMWHLGIYVPYARRATLHDGYFCDDDLAWQLEVRRRREAADTPVYKTAD